MLENLSDNFSSIVNRIKGQGRLTEANVSETVDLIRDTLIDADVALDVVDSFINQVRTKALGQKILNSITPGQTLIKLVNDELVELMGSNATDLVQPGDTPRVILVCGLQGSGKTTTAAKIALKLRKEKKRVLVSSSDVQRPAAIEQLRQLCQAVKVDFYEPASEIEGDAIRRAVSACEAATKTVEDYVIIDTAGRNVIDEPMMEELRELSAWTKPSESLLVIDSGLGQEGLSVARGFGNALDLTGICLSKLDSDARGGAAMSALATLGIPVKLIGVGEKPEDLQRFDPVRMASRILGMGDIVSLVESATAAMGEKKVDALARRQQKRKTAGLALSDMIEQMRQAESMGGFDKMIDYMPANLTKKIKSANVDPKIFRRMEAIYNSMTPFERRNPKMIKGSHKVRIASGAGVEVQQVNQLLTQHAQANKIMKRAARNPTAAMSLMRGLLR